MTVYTSELWRKNYQKGVQGKINLNEYASLNEVFQQSFEKYASLPAFHCMGTTLRYSDVNRLSKDFASYLQNVAKLKKGDRVAIMLPNILQYPVVLMGILQAGMTVVNVNPLYTARELQHQLKDSGAKAIVVLENFAHTLEKVRDQVPVEHIITTQLGDMLGFPKKHLINFAVKKVKKMVPEWNLPGSLPLNEALKKGSLRPFQKQNVAHDDIAFLQYTGGTTGVSKGAILSHGNIIANVLQAKEWIKYLIQEGKEIIITPLPLYHIFSLTANLFIFSSIGSLNVFITNPRDIPGFVKELKKWKFTAFTGINTLFNALLNNEEFKNLDFSTLKVTLGGGMAVQRPVAENWKQVTGHPLIEAYGLTETSPAACINPLHNEEFNGLVGLPISSTEVSIRNDEGAELPLGEVGEVCIRGPQVMKGYWQRPDETALVMTADGFFKTGDLGFMNADGYVKLVDRKKNMILVSGFNVYPNEIEEVMVKHPKILECAAVGIPNEYSGEVVKLFIVKKEESLTVEEVIAFSKENLTGYKVPKAVEFRKELPKTNVGKILHRELRDQHIAAKT